jgi:membrane protein
MNVPTLNSGLAPTRSRREKISQHVNDLLETLKNWPWLDTLRTLRQRFKEDHLGVTASSLTFTTLISLVPLVTVMLAVFSAFPMFASFQGALEKYFLQSLIPDSIAKPVLGALTQFANKSNRLGTAGLVALVVTALALMLTIDRTLNGIWRVRRPRPIAQRILVYWAALTLGPLLLGVSLSLTSYALTLSRGVVSVLPGGVSFLLNAIEFVLLALGAAGLFRYVPNTHVRWRHALAGGVFVSAGFELAKRALAWYLTTVPSYSAVYGALATLPIFFIWIYLGWVIVLLGAVIAAYAPSLQMRVVRQAEVPGYRFAMAVSLLRLLQQARQEEARGLSLEQMATAMRVDPLQIEPILESLVQLDWVGRLDEEGSVRHVLLCDPNQVLAAPMLRLMLLQPNDALESLWARWGAERLLLADLLKA